MAHCGTAVERNRELMNVLLDCNKNGDVTTGFVTSYQQVRIEVGCSLVRARTGLIFIHVADVVPCDAVIRHIELAESVYTECVASRCGIRCERTFN